MKTKDGLKMRPGMDAYDAVSFVTNGRCDRARVVLHRRTDGGVDVCLRLDGIYWDDSLADQMAKYHAERLGLVVAEDDPE